MKEPTSREARFVAGLFSKINVPDNPMVSIMLTQLQKLTSLIDSDPKYQAKVRELLNYVKESWNEDVP